MFLTQGITLKYADYHDPRTHSIPMGVHFARSSRLLVKELGLCCGVNSGVTLHSLSCLSIKGIVRACGGYPSGSQPSGLGSEQRAHPVLLGRGQQ